MGRKSSKRCCIFHKQRPFGESSTDSSDYESDHEGDEDDGDKSQNDSKKGKEGPGAEEGIGTDHRDFTLNKVGRDFTIARNESIGGIYRDKCLPCITSTRKENLTLLEPVYLPTTIS
jgi:hypothetical protein